MSGVRLECPNLISTCPIAVSKPQLIDLRLKVRIYDYSSPNLVMLSYRAEQRSKNLLSICPSNRRTLCHVRVTLLMSRRGLESLVFGKVFDAMKNYDLSVRYNSLAHFAITFAHSTGDSLRMVATFLLFPALTS
jgi:hypothetical protein